MSAVELIKLETPDVILLDISMLEMNGFALIPRFKKISPESKILIMMINDDGRSLQKSFELGVSGFLVKKAMDYDLIYAIRTVARGEKYIYPSMIEGYITSNNKTEIQNSKLTKEEFLWNSLSTREQDVIIDIAHGFKNKEIARYISFDH